MKVNNQEVKLIDHEIELFVHASKQLFSDDFRVDISTFNMSDLSTSDYLLITKVTATIQVPDIAGIDFSSLQVDALEKLKSKLRAECQQKIDRVDEEINSLLAIENKD